MHLALLVLCSRLGGIFCSEFTEQMKGTATRLGLSERIQSLLHTIHEEAVCADRHTKTQAVKKTAETEVVEKANSEKLNEAKADSKTVNNIESTKGGTGREFQTGAKENATSTTTENNTQVCAQNVAGKTEPKTSAISSTRSGQSDKPGCNTGNENRKTLKRPLEAGSDVTDDVIRRKKLRKELEEERGVQREETESSPCFFYNPNKRKIKGVDLPK